MPKVDSQAEEKIKQAAQKIFLVKGYDGATFKEISKEANVNVALVNYYFRSKEKLFQEVFAESFFQYIRAIDAILNQDLPLEVKIYTIVDKYTDLLLSNPRLPVFVLSEMHRNPGMLLHRLGVKENNNDFLQKQLEQEARKGNIRSIDVMQFELTLTALITFPFMARPMMELNGMKDPKDFERFVNERRKLIPEMIIAYLKGTEKQ